MKGYNFTSTILTTSKFNLVLLAYVMFILFAQTMSASAANYPAVAVCDDASENHMCENDYNAECYISGGVCSVIYDGLDYATLPIIYTCPSGGVLSGTTCITGCSSPRYPSGWLVWSDAPITAGVTSIKVTHINELRTNINVMRTDAGMAACSWTDPIVPSNTIAIRKVHIDELRACISAVYSTCGAAVPTFTDPTLTAGQTPIKATHINELRYFTSNAP